MNRKVCVAPMMDCTDRHERFFLRLISKNVLLYTEMIVSEAIDRGDKKKLLSFRPKGLILSGGNDLHNIIKLKENLIRDAHEKKLLKLAIKNKIPILAVCRGFQFVAKFFKCKIFIIT